MDSDPLLLFQQELADDNPETVIAAASRMCLIALAIGPQRTRDELFRFIREYMEQDNEEALTHIGTQLGKCVPYVGGPEHVSSLLSLLEQLACMDETVVRQAAVQSLKVVIPKMPRAEISEKAVAVTRRMAASDWLGSRSSACSLFAVTYPHCSAEVQSEILATYAKLCSDETPLVRESAYENLAALAKSVGVEVFKRSLLPLLKLLLDDGIDSMRIYAVDACTELCGVLPEPETAAEIVPLLTRLQADASWRVRQKTAITIDKIYSLTGPRVGALHILPLLARLLSDTDVPVRLEAAKRLEPMAAVVVEKGNYGPAGCPQFIEFVGPVLGRACGDESDKVRVCVSLALPSLSAALGAEGTQKVLLPLLHVLSKDENQEVRHSVLTNLRELARGLHSGAVPGARLLEEQVLPVLLEMSKDPKWRVRQEVVGQCAMLGAELGREVFDSKIRWVLLACLTDSVCAIRENASAQVLELTKLWGVEWLIASVLPEALALYDKSSNYLHRITTLSVINNVCEIMDAHQVESMLLPIAIKACDDEVANVKFYTARTLTKLIRVLGMERKSKLDSVLRPKLEVLSREADPDVQYFSEQALKELQRYL